MKKSIVVTGTDGAFSGHIEVMLENNSKSKVVHNRILHEESTVYVKTSDIYIYIECENLPIHTYLSIEKENLEKQLKIAEDFLKNKLSSLANKNKINSDLQKKLNNLGYE